jgi:type I restriction enzyme, S subunit
MSDWSDGQLADSIAALDAGVSVNAEDRPHGAGEIGVLKTSAVSGGRFLPEQNKTVIERERHLVAEPVQGDSILVSRMNTPALVGESCYVQDAHPSLFLPDRLWQLKPKDRTSISMRWLSFALQASVYRRYVQVHATGTSGSMKNLPKSKLLALPLSYPAPPEQAKVAEVLGSLDTAIQETESIIAKLKAVKQGLLHDLLTRGIDANGELRPAHSDAPHRYKESPLGWIPKEWESKPFGDFCESSAFGPRFPSDAYEETGPLATLRTTDMDDDGRISLSTMPRAAIAPSVFADHLLRVGDIVMSRSGTCGVTGVFSGHDIPVVPGAFLIRFRLRDLRLNQFYRRYFNSSLGRPYLERLAVGGVQKNIKGSDVLCLQVPVPTATEAVSITQRIESVEHDIESNQQLLKKMGRQKSGLMDDLLGGRVRVTPLLVQAGQ